MQSNTGERMKTIKFSHEYFKMLNNESETRPIAAILMETFVVNSEDLHPRFVEYDNEYIDKKEHNRGYYVLPKGKVIVLLLKSFVHGELMLWTTIRRYTPAKFEYYKNARWEEFEIILM